MSDAKIITWKYFILVACLALLAGSSEVTKAYENKQESRPVKEIEKYIYKKTPQSDLAVYIHFPPGWTKQDKRSAIVFFAGGWVGTADQFKYQAEYLASRGMVAARAEYRGKLRGDATIDKCIEDGKSAVRWLRKNASMFGVDPNRIAASGGSSGGHMAACTYTTKGLEAEGEDQTISSKPNLLILFNPVLDLSVPMYSKYVKYIPVPVEMISPNLNLTEKTPPTILFYGTKDVLLDQGKAYLNRARQLGFEATLYTADGADHGFFNNEPWLSKTLYLADEFLSKHGYIQGQPTIETSKNAQMVEMRPGK